MNTAAARTTGTLSFRKMHGIGNDFVVVDGVRGPLPPTDPAVLARSVCDRRFGIGSDGLIYIEREGGDGTFRMRMWNPDGSESEMCGNGIRCVARYLIDEGIVTPTPDPSRGAGGGELRIPIETGAGLLVLEDAGGGLVRVDMGVARLTRGEIGMTGPAGERFVGQPVEVPGSGQKGGVEPGLEGSLAGAYRGTAVSMGNPHLVIIFPVPGGTVLDVDLEKVGPVLEHHPLFPNRTNVHFVSVVDRGHIVQRTWERGAGATLACGTGACACAVACFENGLTDRSVDVDLPGGRLRIEYLEDGRVYMTGPAKTVFDGEWGLA